jgi:colanic acid/amylovoran biosynthesis glycosyltransferase
MAQQVVVHSHPTWLPITQIWLYNQVTHLPPYIESHVVCEQVENLDSFGVPNLHALSLAPRWPAARDRLFRRLRLRRHLGFLIEVGRKINADIVHSHFGNVGWIDMGAVRRLGTRHVVTFYGLDTNLLPRSYPRWRGRYAQLFSRVDRVLCEGPHMAETVGALGCPEDKIRVHHLGVAVERIPFVPRSWDGVEPLRVLIAASFREKKGVPYALGALAALRREVPIEVTIIGDASSDPRDQEEKVLIQQVIDRNGMRPIVRMLGYQPHSVLLEEAYRHHVFLSPSVMAANGDTEGGAPMAIAEMAASGMPIVSTSHCDIPNVVQHEVTGLLAPERDEGALARLLRQLLEHPSQWLPMVERGRQRIETEFNAAEQGRRLGALYRELWSEGPSS